MPSAGLTLLKVGALDMVFGRFGVAVLIAVCTSWAAPSISRLRSNCRTIWVLPAALEEVIEVTCGTAAKARSNGVAIEEAMVSALAPESLAVT